MYVSLGLAKFLWDNPLPWIKIDPETEDTTLVVDNQLLSTFRNCPQHFIYTHVLGWQKKGLGGEGRQRSWFLDFGILVHKMLEMYYTEFRKPGFDAVAWFSKRAAAEWDEAAMDVHCEHKEYKIIGGKLGFVTLLVQYVLIFGPQSEHFRVIGTEVSFGRAGEVPLLVDPGQQLSIFLAGRMDKLIDDGYFICPLDHKTQGSFRGDPGLQYETDDGPTGYVFALSKILPSLVPPGELLKRDCSKILMNLIQKKPTAVPAERFRRVVIRKTTEQLLAYQFRQIDTAMHMVEELENFVRNGNVMRNCTACTNWHYGVCDYRDVCRQNSKVAEEATLSNGYVKLPIWNTENVKPAQEKEF
jgi:hypothetical protein